MVSSKKRRGHIQLHFITRYLSLNQSNCQRKRGTPHQLKQPIIIVSWVILARRHCDHDVIGRSNNKHQSYQHGQQTAKVLPTVGEELDHPEATLPADAVRNCHSGTVLLDIVAHSRSSDTHFAAYNLRAFIHRKAQLPCLDVRVNGLNREVL